MRRLLGLLFVAGLARAAWAAAADAVDPMQSADCRRALESLQTQEAVVFAARRAPGALAPAEAGSPIDALRRDAARACLGGNGDPPPPKQIATSPVVVSPIVVARPAPAAPLLISALPATPRRAEPPVLISSCDPGGCWASNGTRLIRVGAHLVGPHGLCSGTQGTPLNCR